MDLRHVSSCKMFTFCDVLHETKQNRKQTFEIAQYGLEISLNDVIHASVLQLVMR